MERYMPAVEAKRRYRAKTRLRFKRYFEQLKCIQCGKKAARVNRVMNLEFHHRDPADKLFSVGLADRCWATMVREMDKCDVLCRSCHNKAHDRQFGLDGRFIAGVGD